MKPWLWLVVLLPLVLGAKPELPAASVTDPSNRFLHNPAAVTLGQQLFFDVRLSRNGQISCASCHQPDKAFTDGKTVAVGLAQGTRNTPTLLGVAQQDWFFWDGRKDSLWSQALESLENPAEHGLTRVEVVQRVLQQPQYRQQYAALLPTLADVAQISGLPPASPNGTLEQLQAWKQLPREVREQVDSLFAATGKFIATYVSSLPLPKRPVPQSEAVIAGARLFHGKAQCSLCHSGALFSNQTFQNIGTGSFGRDSGRAAVVDTVRHDRFNCLGHYSDAQPRDCSALRFLNRERHALVGAFKVPHLVALQQTAPYFHDGRAPTLQAVVEHYVEAAQHQPKENDLPPLELTAQEKQQLVRFLEAL